MAEPLPSRKPVAAVVMIAGLATMLSAWALTRAGQAVKATGGWECDQVALEDVVLRLEVARRTAEVEAIFAGAPEPCVREIGRAMIARDWLFLAAYGCLVAAMFALLAGLRVRGARVRWGWVGAGVLLGAVAALADAVENRLLLDLLVPLDERRPDLASTLASLHAATTVKWGALALSAAAAAALWAWRPRRPRRERPRPAVTNAGRWIDGAGLAGSWLAAAAGVAAAMALTWALGREGDAAVAGLRLGAALLAVFWGCTLARALGVAAEPPPLLPGSDLPPEGAAGEAGAPPGAAAPQRGGLFTRAYPEPLAETEWRLSCQRRREAEQPVEAPRTGFGLSGGGIRSATFNLGVFQGIARQSAGDPPPPAERRVLDRIDYLSTVSGGGYFGAFLGRLWTRRFVTGPRDVARVLVGASDNGKKVLRYLRENGRYLSPNGAGDLLLGGAVVLRNWVSVQLVLCTFLLTVFLGLQAARPALDRGAAGLPPALSCLFDLAGTSFWWSPWLLLPIVCFAFIAFPLGWAYWMVEPVGGVFTGAARPRAGTRLARLARLHLQDRSAIAPLAGLCLTFVAALVLAAAVGTTAWRAFWLGVALAAALAYACYRIAGGAAGRRAARAAAAEAKSEGVAPAAPGEPALESRIHAHASVRHLLSVWLTGALVATGVLLALGLVDSLGQSLYVALLGPDPYTGWLAGIFSALSVLAGYARRIAILVGSRVTGDERPSLPVNLAAGVAALLLVVLILVCLNATSHAVAWRLGAPIGSLQWRQAARDCTEPAAAAAPCSPAELARRECGEDGEPALRAERDWQLAGIALLAGFVLSVFFGQTFPFVNRSSHLPLYSDRLARSYLGASNEDRWTESVTRVIRGDDVDLTSYWPPPAGKAAPIHLINVTVNETVSGRSQIEQKDRKGNNLALGPCGLSFGVEHHAVIPLGEHDPTGKPVAVYPEAAGEFRVFEYPRRAGARVFAGESLPLGDWVGISGAAFSTGLGSRTSLGLSLLAGFGNVRLGLWWDSGVDAAARSGSVRPTRLTALEHAAARLFPVQVFLLDEFLARFHGTARRHWYLSDGGHFENLGGYELLRRRLPMVVLVDAEEDAGFAFGGLSNLIRKARIDFGAEITFLDARALGEEIDDSMRGTIGTLEELRRGSFEEVPPSAEQPWRRWRLAADDPAGFSRAHAALARVVYADEPQRTTRLLYVKATLTGDEPADVLEYHRAHPAFPHESTADQFFDEAQWESYRKLGEHIAQMLFERPRQPAEPAAKRWWPDELA